MEQAKRRQRLPAPERRAQLMDATIRLLARDGFAKTTADAIVAEAGVSKGLIWRLFDSLDDLHRQSGRYALRQIGQGIGRQVDLTGPVPDVIRQAIAAATQIPVQWPEQHRAIQQVVMNLRKPDGSLAVSVSDYADLREAQEAFFRRGQSDGDIRDDIDPHILAITYQAGVDAMIAHLEADPELDAARYATQLADTLLDGMRGPGRTSTVAHHVQSAQSR